MNKNQTARIITPGQMKELIGAIAEGIPADMDFEVAARWIGRKKILAENIKCMLSIGNPDAGAIIIWQNFYKSLFNQKYDFSSVTIPECPGAGWRLLFVVDLSLEQLYVKCRELFLCWRWADDNFDKIVVKNERDARKGPYAIWVRDRVEADEELKNLSTNDIKSKNLTTETLAERFIHELKFFNETGQHLDIDNVTLCSGSRLDDGFIPFVRWLDSKLLVFWCRLDFARGHLRSRQAVS